MRCGRLSRAAASCTHDPADPRRGDGGDASRLVFADYARLPNWSGALRSPAMVIRSGMSGGAWSTPAYNISRCFATSAAIPHAGHALDPLRLAEQMGRPKAAAPKVRARRCGALSRRWPGRADWRRQGMKGDMLWSAFPASPSPSRPGHQHLLSRPSGRLGANGMLQVERAGIRVRYQGKRMAGRSAGRMAMPALATTAAGAIALPASAARIQHQCGGADASRPPT